MTNLEPEVIAPAPGTDLDSSTHTQAAWDFVSPPGPEAERAQCVLQGSKGVQLCFEHALARAHPTPAPLDQLPPLGFVPA